MIVEDLGRATEPYECQRTLNSRPGLHVGESEIEYFFIGFA